MVGVRGAEGCWGMLRKRRLSENRAASAAVGAITPPIPTTNAATTSPRAAGQHHVRADSGCRCIGVGAGHRAACNAPSAAPRCEARCGSWNAGGGAGAGVQRTLRRVQYGGSDLRVIHEARDDARHVGCGRQLLQLRQHLSRLGDELHACTRVSRRCFVSVTELCACVCAWVATF